MILIHKDPDHEVWAELHEGRVWLHQQVRKWTVRVRKQSLDILRFLHEHFQADLWVCDNTVEAAPNLPRYLKALGFKPKELWVTGGDMRTCFLRERNK